MTLQFAHEVVIVNGLPLMGTVTVEVEGQLDRHDGLYDLDLTCTGFEPYAPLGLKWYDVAAPCEAWLRANRARVEKKALRP